MMTRLACLTKSIKSNSPFLLLTIFVLVFIFRYTSYRSDRNSFLLNEAYLIEQNQFQWCYDYEPNYEQTFEDTTVDCDGIFEGDRDAIKNAKNWTSPCPYSDLNIVSHTEDCLGLKRRFQFLDAPSSREEANFPLAYVLLVEKEAEQVLRLLSTIYQPQNLYCLTYDRHGDELFKHAMESLVRCFPDNFYTPETKIEIFRADFSILEATMDCLRILSFRNPNHEWKYVQILSWNDVPLKTNYEMVEILKLFNGSNDVELSDGQVDRFRQYHRKGDLDQDRKNIKRPVPPNGLIIYKGSPAVTLSRDFVTFLFHDSRAQLFYDWCRPMGVPGEQFFSTLIHNQQLNQPGSFPGTCLQYYNFENRKKDWISRYQISNEKECYSKKLIGVSCVFGLDDLRYLKNRVHLVAHKMYMTFEPAALYCMHRRLYEKRRMKVSEINLDDYANLSAIRYQRLEDKNEFSC